MVEEGGNMFLISSNANYNIPWVSEIESKVKQGNTTAILVVQNIYCFIVSSSSIYSISDKECIMDLEKPFMVINNF